MTEAALRMGTRGSALALWQAHHVQTRLAAQGVACALTVIQTTGDRRTDVPLATLGGKGLFLKEIETELAAGRIDFAVHSLKDVPSTLSADFQLAAVLEREDPRDALIAAPGMTLGGLPPRARLGTGSLRRQAQILALRPDLQILPLRGNVDTRLGRWRAGDFDAIVLAAAGLKRLGHAAVIAEWLDPEQVCPSGGQGALALECRAADPATAAALARLHHPETAVAVTCERALLAALDCGCQSPVGAYAQLAPDGGLHLTGVAAAPDGSRVLRVALRGAPATGLALGQAAAAALLRQGAAAFLQ